MLTNKIVQILFLVIVTRRKAVAEVDGLAIYSIGCFHYVYQIGVQRRIRIFISFFKS